jgi:ribosomal protein L11 methyltransferase
VIRLALRVRREQAEIALAELLELAPAGVEEVDVSDDVIEYAVYGAPGELPSLPDLRAVAGGALLDVFTSELPDDWSERWRSFHRPVLIEPPRDAVVAVPGLYVRPPWEAPCDRAGAQEIVIDPGQAFGTGAHATTHMCLELLLQLAGRGLAAGRLLDAGTGSGVLAIAGARLGWSPVIGIDHERESVQAARDNAAVNGVAIDVRRADLTREPAPAAPTVVANLLRPLLLELAPRLTAPPANLIVSGLLAGEVDEVAAAFAVRHRLVERQRRRSGEWASAWLASAD